MPILNYTTKVDEHRTVAEIQSLLSKKGAEQVLVEYHNGRPEAVMFRLRVGGQSVPFKLPCKFEGVRQAMLREVKDRWAKSRKEKDVEFANQARRVAWRIVKDWIEAQMALIEAGQAEIAEVFLPYVVIAGGRTMFQAFTENSTRLLGPGDESE
jgi:hypothetical protein